MAYNNRPMSPGGRRIINPGRTSDSRISDASTDAYRSERHNSYAPKSTGGVIPISTETFVNYPSSQASRSGSDQLRYDAYSGKPIDSATGRPMDTYASRQMDAYSGRPRRSSLVDNQRGSSGNVPQRNRPTVVQNDFARALSPVKGSQGKDYFVTPATTSKEPVKEQTKKLYAVENGTANLVADVNVPAGGARHHKRRDSSDGLERGGYRNSGAERERGRRTYHLNGPVKPSKEKSIDDEDAYSYTDAAGMFRDTEPRWREREVRPRRGSVDRGGASRERPVSMLVDPTGDARRTVKDGPPPSTRGWDKIGDGLLRARTTRERPKENPQSPTRAKGPQMPQSPTRGRYPDNGGYGDQTYYIAPRTSSTDDRRYVAINPERPADRYDQSDYFEERREPRRERRSSTSRAQEPSVERRGFGIRGESQDRYGRRSDENFSQPAYYRDSGYAAPEQYRRETVPELSYLDEQRFEQDKRDRVLADRTRSDEQQRERQWERDNREREQKYSYDDQRAYTRDYDRDRDQRRDREAEYDLDRERERERERMMQPAPQPQPERDRYQYRSDGYSDQQHYDRNEHGPRTSNETITQPNLSSTAALGLGGAAAAYGLNNMHNKKDDREKDRSRDWEHDRLQDRSQHYEPERVSPRLQDLRHPSEPQLQETHSDEGMAYQERDRYGPADNHDRSLGFAFEHPPPEPPRSAPPISVPPPAAPPIGERPEPIMTRDAIAERDFERTHDDTKPPAHTPHSTVDPDEDYRRRMEQAQRELGRGSEDRASDSDPDRERRRREREQRQRERDFKYGDGSVIGTNSTFTNSTFTDTTASYQMPGAFDNESVDGTNTTISGPNTLKRKPSILDQPMFNEPAQIIDNSLSEKRENRVRIVDPPTEEEERRPKGILKKPTEKFPEHPNEVREGVAPLKDASKSGIPPGARWTKIDRKLVNPEALEDAKERFEERMDCVIVLRVLTKEEIQKLADRTKQIRDERYEQERDERKAARRRDRRERDEYIDDDSDDEYKPRAPMMLEAPPSAAGASSTNQSDHSHKDRHRERDGEREQVYMSGGLGRRDDYS